MRTVDLLTVDPLVNKFVYDDMKGIHVKSDSMSMWALYTLEGKKLYELADALDKVFSTGALVELAHKSEGAFAHYIVSNTSEKVAVTTTSFKYNNSGPFDIMVILSGDIEDNEDDKDVIVAMVLFGLLYDPEDDFLAVANDMITDFEGEIQSL